MVGVGNQSPVFLEGEVEVNSQGDAASRKSPKRVRDVFNLHRNLTPYEVLPYTFTILGKKCFLIFW